MYRLILFFTCFFVFSICRAQNKEVNNLVDQFIDTLATHSFMRSKVDFDKLRRETKLKAVAIDKIDSLLPIFKNVVSELEDHHSRAMRVEDTTDELALIKMIANTTYEQEGMSPLNFQHHMIEGKYAYINVPGVLLEHRRYLNTLQKQMRELDDKQPKAWIIDLTENDGGSFVPMVIPFHSLIDTSQTFSYFDGTRDKDGNEILVDKFQIPQNGLYIDNSIEAKYCKFDTVQGQQLKNNKIPIIVLVSELTASSGEITASHFLGQKDVTVIGTKTCGLTSANELYYINKGYSVNLMTALLHDRKGKSYAVGEGIDPDILIDVVYPEKINTFKERYHFIKEQKPVFVNKALELLKAKGI